MRIPAFRLALAVVAGVWTFPPTPSHAQLSERDFYVASDADAEAEHEADASGDSAETLETDAEAEPDPETARAREHFQRGVVYYQDGDLDAARVEFQRAMQARENYKLLYNLGQVSAELRDYPAAERYLERYLAEGGDEIDHARKRQVRESLTRLADRIATIQLSCNLEGATFFVDDVPVGEQPLDKPIRVSAGRRRVVATYPGRDELTRVVELAGREAGIVHLEFAPPRAPLGALAEEPSDVRPALWLGITSGVLLAGAGVMAILTLRDRAAYEDELEQMTTRDELDRLATRVETKALVTDVLLGAGVIVGVSALVVVLTSGSSERPVSERGDTDVALGPGSLHVTTRF